MAIVYLDPRFLKGNRTMQPIGLADPFHIMPKDESSDSHLTIFWIMFTLAISGKHGAWCAMQRRRTYSSRHPQDAPIEILSRLIPIKICRRNLSLERLKTISSRWELTPQETIS